MEELLKNIGDALALAALVAGGLLKDGDTFVLRSGRVPDAIYVFTGEAVTTLPDWAHRATIAALRCEDGGPGRMVVAEALAKYSPTITARAA